MRVRVRAVRRLALALCLWSASGPVRGAFGDDVDALRQALVSGTKATWPESMDTIGKSASAVGAVVGPMLRERDAKRTPATAYAAAWLCEHPIGGRVLLDEEIVRRGALDPAFVDALKANLAPDGAGWSRLVSVARGLLQAPIVSDAALTLSAATFLRHEATASNARDLLDVWDRADERSELRIAARASFESVLGGSFDDPDTARRFLDARRGRPLFEWVRDVSLAKDRSDAPRFRRLLKEAAANLERVTTPEGLTPYLDPKTTPWPEVRRLAAERSTTIDPQADGWTHLLESAVFNETDPETLDTLMRAATRESVEDRKPYARLAEQAADRLRRSPAPADELSIGFLTILRRVGTPAQLRAAFTTLIERRASIPVLDAWLDAASEFHELSAEIRELHRSRRASTDPVARALSLHALSALAKGGPEIDGDAAANAAYLSELLPPWSEGPDVPAALWAEERSAAARALEVFPVPASVVALGARAADPAEEPQFARLAASVLGRLAWKEAHGESEASFGALEALIALAANPHARASRASAFDDLARLGIDGVELRDDEIRVREVVRGALASDAPLEVRRAGARAAAAFGDARSLPGVYRAVADELAIGTDAPSGPAPWTGKDSAYAAAETLVRALAAHDDTNDLDLAKNGRDLFGTGPAGAKAALDLAVAASDAGGARLSLQTARAALLLRRAQLHGQPADDRIGDLEEAHRVLSSALRSTTEADRASESGLRALALDHAIVGWVLKARVARLNWDRRSPIVVPPGDVGLEWHRGLDAAIRATRLFVSASATLSSAIDADAALLKHLRTADVVELRRAALVESAKFELSGARDAESLERARRHASDARALAPTQAESADLDAIETDLAGEKSPAAPR